MFKRQRYYHDKHSVCLWLNVWNLSASSLSLLFICFWRCALSFSIFLIIMLAEKSHVCRRENLLSVFNILSHLADSFSSREIKKFLIEKYLFFLPVKMYCSGMLVSTNDNDFFLFCLAVLWACWLFFSLKNVLVFLESFIQANSQALFTLLTCTDCTCDLHNSRSNFVLFSTEIRFALNIYSVKR